MILLNNLEGVEGDNIARWVSLNNRFGYLVEATHSLATPFPSHFS